MKSIAFFNNKGGVAKTTSVCNIAYILGEVYTSKILVIDCDGQQNSSRFLADNLNVSGIEKALISENTSPEESLSHTRYENIDVLISSPEMNDCSEKFSKLEAEQQKKNINKLIRLWDEKYDYILLDMPPTLNFLTESIISAVDGVVVPVELNSFAIQGIAKVTETINKVGTSFIGCFISKYDKKNKADSELKELLKKSLGDKVFRTVIPYSNIIKNSITYKTTAYEYMHWLTPARKYVELTEEIIRKV